MPGRVSMWTCRVEVYLEVGPVAGIDVGVGAYACVGTGACVDVGAGASVDVGEVADVGAAVGGSSGVLVGAGLSAGRSVVTVVVPVSQASIDPTARRPTNPNQGIRVE